MLLFRSEEHIDRWNEAQGRERGDTMSLDQQWALAQAWYPDRLRVDWHRRSPAEAQELFDHIGLTGDFWRLA